jgi:long-subunit acyl-CoA synthetase (AMP-forming)
MLALNRPGAHRAGTIGRPIPGLEVGVTSKGELRIRGPMVAFPDTAPREASGWLLTGRRVRMDADGYLLPHA